MEAAHSSETSVHFYLTTRRNIPQDSDLRSTAVRILNVTNYAHFIHRIYRSYATGRNSLTCLFVVHICIYCRHCRLCIINAIIKTNVYSRFLSTLIRLWYPSTERSEQFCSSGGTSDCVWQMPCSNLMFENDNPKSTVNYKCRELWFAAYSIFETTLSKDYISVNPSRL
jgi:hypothetical protein